MSKSRGEERDGALIDAAIDAVRRALAEDGGTVVVAAPAGRAVGEVVDGVFGRATVVVYGGDAYFLRTRLSSSSSSQHRTGWYRVPLPGLNIHRRR